MNIIDFYQRDFLSVLSDILSLFGIPTLFVLNFKKSVETETSKNDQKLKRTKKSKEWSLPFWSGKSEEEYTEGSIEDINTSSKVETNLTNGKEDNDK